MAQRKPAKSNPINPIALTTAALKACKSATDYHRLGTTTEPEVFQAAWERLTEVEQQQISQIVNSNAQPDPQIIADELAACGSLIELQSVKSGYGDVAVKAAWKLLPSHERDRLTAICKNGQQQPAEKPQPVTEQPAHSDTNKQPERRDVSQIPATYPENVAKVNAWLKKEGFRQPQHEPEPEPQPTLEPQPTIKKPTLIELTADLQQLDELLETIEDGNIPVDLQIAVDELLAQREATQEAVLEKIDSYCGLIQSRLMWAATRKAEAERLIKLAESDFKTIDFLKARLKAHLEANDQKKIRTKHFNISVCQNGGKAPLRFDDTLPEQMPERFQRNTVKPNSEAIRAALEAGEELGFAYLGKRENHLRIK